MNIEEQLKKIFPDQSSIREKDFPLLNKLNRVYLDNTATSQEPLSVIKRMDRFRKTNLRGSNHSENSDEALRYDREVKEVRIKVSNFFHANNYCTVFTKNTTESSNFIACRFPFTKNSTLIVTEMEHNSEIVTSANCALNSGSSVEYAPIDFNGLLDLNMLDKMISKSKGIVLFNIVHIANFTGVINPIKEIKKIYGDKIFIYADLAQSGGHLPINLDEMNVDFAGTSSHKMNGPMGMGALFIRKDRVDMLSKEIAGGGAVKRVTKEKFIYMDSPACFEPGTQDLEGIIEFGYTVDYLKKIGMDKIHKYDYVLSKYFFDNIRKIKNVILYGPDDFTNRSVIVPFNIKSIYSHNQVARLLNKKGISVRNGCFCAHIYVAKMIGLTDEEYIDIVNKDLSHEDMPGTVRISFSFYNDLNDIHHTLNAIEDIANQK
jgi:cysteine desulfurase / selenocysteine lyase